MTLSCLATVPPNSCLLRADPKLENTISTRTLRSCASRIICRPTGPVIRLKPFWASSREPLLRFVTEKSASVLSGVAATWSAIVPSISQYGT